MIVEERTLVAHRERPGAHQPSNLRGRSSIQTCRNRPGCAAGLAERNEEIEGNALARLNLRFALGTNMKNALVEVIGRLNRLRPLPLDADRPVVRLGGEGNTNETLSWFFVQLLPGTPGPIEAQRRYIEDTVRSRLESIPGWRRWR
jgi:hypothetical protein